MRVYRTLSGLIEDSLESQVVEQVLYAWLDNEDYDFYLVLEDSPEDVVNEALEVMSSLLGKGFVQEREDKFSPIPGQESVLMHLVGLYPEPYKGCAPPEEELYCLSEKGEELLNEKTVEEVAFDFMFGESQGDA